MVTTTWIPLIPSPTRYDADTDEYCNGGGGGKYSPIRGRNQGQVSLTKYAEKFGTHAFKFGPEIERSHVRIAGAAVRAGRVLTYSTGRPFRNSRIRRSGATTSGPRCMSQDPWNADRSR